MTGQSCYVHGMGTNAPTGDYFDEEDTLPTLIKKQGYQTAMVGKAHFHPQRKHHGFDQTITLDSYYRQVEQDGGPRPRRHGLGENELVPTLSTVPEERTITSWTTERACEWLRHDRDPSKPWFLWVSYTKPHAPLDPCEPYYSMYKNSDIPEPWRAEWDQSDLCPNEIRKKQFGNSIDLLDMEQIKAARAAYYGLITQIDYNIGRLTAAIQDTGAFFNPRDNTLIIFHSDHGDHLGDHGRTAKDDAYEGSWHIPLVVRAPRTWEKDKRHLGSVATTNACVQDIYATCIAAAGGELPEQCYGQDLLAVMNKKEAPREWILGGCGFNKKRPDNIAWSAITNGRWKYIWYYDGGQEQLFDLEADPREECELSGDAAHAVQLGACRKQLVKELMAVAPRFVDESGERPVARPKSELPSVEEMRAAGFPGHMWDLHPSDALH